MHLYRNPKRIWNDIEEAIKYILYLGLIRPSSNPYSSLAFMVNKNDGTLRMCIYCIGLNKKKMENMYPIPRIDKIMYKLHGAKFFSNIELRSTSHQIRMKEEDIPKSAFICHYGHLSSFPCPFS